MSSSMPLMASNIRPVKSSGLPLVAMTQLVGRSSATTRTLRADNCTFRDSQSSERINREAFGAGSPGFANELVGREALEGFEPAAEVVSRDEVGEMLAELVMAFIVDALDRCVFYGSVHSLDLTVGPRVLRFGGPMVDVILCTGEFEGARKSSPFAIASLIKGTAAPPAPGVVNWMPLSVSTVWIL
jgi:hypothetical protein